MCFRGPDHHIPTQSSSSSSTATDASSSGYSSDDSDSSADTRRHRDGTQCTATQDELAIARQLAKDPWGRFGGKEGKMARIRRQEAALAGGVHTTPSMQPAPKPKVVKKKTKIPTTTTTKPVVIVIGDDKDDEAMDVDVPQRVVDGQWWGARYFAWGGLLGSSLRRTATRQRGFSERDQEVLYMQTQDGKVKGKQGLGRAGRAGELRGVAWKGSKVVFAEGPHKGIMWKAHVKRVLRQVRCHVWLFIATPTLCEQTKKRRMRTSKLAAAVMRALQAAGHNGDMDAGTVQSTMVRKIQRSKSFVCTDKHVALVECAP